MSLVEQERRGPVLVITIRREDKRNAIDEVVTAAPLGAPIDMEGAEQVACRYMTWLWPVTTAPRLRYRQGNQPSPGHSSALYRQRISHPGIALSDVATEKSRLDVWGDLGN